MVGVSSPARACGSCTLCCKLMGVTELDKPVNTWCRQCDTSGGCKIYDTRPQSCRDFICGWLADDSLPDSLRPDRSKVVIGINADASRVNAVCDPTQPLAWKAPLVHDQLKAWATLTWDMGRLVTARVGETLWLITPNGDVELGAIPQDAAIAVTRRPDGKLEVNVTV